jgi:PGF-pre-PGF domain-containing protein
VIGKIRKMAIKLNVCILKIFVHIILVLFLALYAIAASANYGAGTYGNGIYGEDEPSSSTTTTSSTSSSSSSSSGGGGGLPSTQGVSAAHVWSTAKDGDTLSMNIKSEEIGILKVEVSINKEVNKVEISVEKLTEKPSAVRELESNVYQYFDINKKNMEDNDIDKVVVRFEVTRSWIEVNAITKDNIVLKHFKDNVWENLPTILINDDTTKEGFVLYEAQGNSLSYFAIAVKEPSLGAGALPSNETCSESWECTTWNSCADGKERRACDDINKCGIFDSKPDESRDCISEVKPEEIKITFGKFALWTLIFLVVLFLLIAFYFIYRNYVEIALYRRPKQDENRNNRGFTLQQKDLDILNDFIIKSLGMGSSESRIKSELVKVGWPNDLVVEQLRKIK